MTSRPETRPMPVTLPAPGASSSYMPKAASGEHSRNGEPASRTRAIRSRTRNLPCAGARQPFAQVGDELLHPVAIRAKGRVRRIDVRVEDYHPQQSVLKPQAGQRQTACIRYISVLPQRSHTILSSAGGETPGVDSRRTGGRGGVGSAIRAIIARAEDAFRSAAETLL